MAYRDDTSPVSSYPTPDRQPESTVHWVLCAPLGCSFRPWVDEGDSARTDPNTAKPLYHLLMPTSPCVFVDSSFCDTVGLGFAAISWLWYMSSQFPQTVDESVYCLLIPTGMRFCIYLPMSIDSWVFHTQKAHRWWLLSLGNAHPLETSLVCLVISWLQDQEFFLCWNAWSIHALYLQIDLLTQISPLGVCHLRMIRPLTNSLAPCFLKLWSSDNSSSVTFSAYKYFAMTKCYYISGILS